MIRCHPAVPASSRHRLGPAGRTRAVPDGLGRLPSTVAPLAVPPLVVPRLAVPPRVVPPRVVPLRVVPPRVVPPLVALLLVVALFAVALLAAAPPAHAAVPSAEDFLGLWHGEIDMPVVKVEFLLNLKQEGGAWTGTMDIPAQGTRDLPLNRVEVNPPEVRFAIPNVPGEPLFIGVLADERVTGVMQQSGHDIPFRMARDPLERANRPQEPKAPFPYRTEEVTVRDGDVVLAGTLTTPLGVSGPYPAVLLLTGSGAQNRDEEIFGHKPFLVLADHLTKAGMAVLRMDDRGVGGSNGKVHLSTTADFARDALAGVRFLRSRREIDRRRIGLAGHSEGGTVAALAAARSKDVAFVILLAGAGVPGADLVLRQAEEMSRARGLPKEAVAAEQELLREAIRLVTAGADSAAMHESLAATTLRLRGGVADSLKASIELAQTSAAAMSQAMRTPWFRHFLRYDPRDALRQVRVPALALAGELDMQVSPAQNLPEIEAALRERSKDVTVRLLPGLNHLFQPARRGLPEEYEEIETTVDPGVLRTIEGWIVERFPPR